MKIETFKKRANRLTAKLDALINSMPKKGNTPSECQRLTILQELYGLIHAINGTEQKDLE
jgi:hypothetical protein